MTLVELVIRSMRKNIKHYYLYFFVLIFSSALYFIFASLQYDASIAQLTNMGTDFSILFRVAGILLLFIVLMFTVYANRIFLKRRSKEIGLYQLIGLAKKGVARLLIIENLMLGAGALLAGICCGALVSRLFHLILLKLLGFELVIEFSFSIEAAAQTAMVFVLLILATSLQMLLLVYRSSLQELFYADKQGEHPRMPTAFAAAFLAVLGIALIGYGYQLSGHMEDGHLMLNMLLVLCSTIVGTYLLFRVTISWLFYQYRKRKNGHLGVLNSLSLAPLMHRMKANASSLTIITVLSAMTLTMIAVAYSFYYSAESDTRATLPYDFIFENREQEANAFSEDLQREGIAFKHTPLDAVRLKGAINRAEQASEQSLKLLLLPAERLQAAGADMSIPEKGEAVHFDARVNTYAQSKKENNSFPQQIILAGEAETLQLTGFVKTYAMNFNVYGMQLVISEATLNEIKEKAQGLTEYEDIHIDTYSIPDSGQRATAASLYAQYAEMDKRTPDFHTEYQDALHVFGLFIFIGGFLGLVFLISTGSILYFKQMTEAELEKRSFVTLRQLGFNVSTIMKGIMRKQLFVFVLPLLIGLLHAAFAVNAASAMVYSSILLPSVIAMGVYVTIYFIFAVLTIGYYRKIVKNAM